MKKKITVIIALFCIVSVLFALVACDGIGDKDKSSESVQSGDKTNSGSQSGDNTNSGSQSGEVTTKSEIQHLRKVMTAVLNEFSGIAKYSNSLLTNLSVGASGDGKVEFEKSVALQDIYDCMGTAENKETVEEKWMNEIAVRNFIAVLTYGELIDQYCNTDKIFGLPLEIKMAENTLPSTAYAIILSEGSRITVYFYGKDDTVGELVYKYDVDYVSDSEFSARMIMLNKSRLDSDDNRKIGSYYFYGDTDGDVVCGLYQTNYDGDDNGSAITYKSADSDFCYRSADQVAVRQCFSKVKSEYDGIDLELVRSLKNSCQNTVDIQQYNQIADRLCEQYGIE